MREKQERRSLFGKRGWLLSHRSLLPLFRLKASSARSAFRHTMHCKAMYAFQEPMLWADITTTPTITHLQAQSFKESVCLLHYYRTLWTTSEPILLIDPACGSPFIMIRDQSDFRVHVNVNVTNVHVPLRFVSTWKELVGTDGRATEGLIMMQDLFVRPSAHRELWSWGDRLIHRPLWTCYHGGRWMNGPQLCFINPTQIKRCSQTYQSWE